MNYLARLSWPVLLAPVLLVPILHWFPVSANPAAADYLAYLQLSAAWNTLYTQRTGDDLPADPAAFLAERLPWMRAPPPYLFTPGLAWSMPGMTILARETTLREVSPAPAGGGKGAWVLYLNGAIRSLLPEDGDYFDQLQRSQDQGVILFRQGSPALWEQTLRDRHDPHLVSFALAAVARFRPPLAEEIASLLSASTPSLRFLALCALLSLGEKKHLPIALQEAETRSFLEKQRLAGLIRERWPEVAYDPCLPARADPTNTESGPQKTAPNNLSQ